MEALLYEKLENNKVKCHVCNHYCEINDGKRGICGVRENNNGVLYTINYNRAVTVNIDPIEKKPLYHYMPGTKTYSLATIGCNMNCKWCQNHRISQESKHQEEIKGMNISPKEHLSYVQKYNIPSISYTYTEPTIYVEYALDIMKLAHKKKRKNIWVSNGYMSDETLELIIPYLDAINIDYKGNDTVYEKYCLGDSKTVLKNLKRLKDAGVHIEITTLLIPGVNDGVNDINEIVDDILHAVGNDVVWHISRFFPQYKMTNRKPTPIDTLKLAQEIGTNKGIKHIYLGNV